jgi:hypothetical protein
LVLAAAAQATTLLVLERVLMAVLHQHLAASTQLVAAVAAQETHEVTMVGQVAAQTTVIHLLVLATLSVLVSQAKVITAATVVTIQAHQ